MPAINQAKKTAKPTKPTKPQGGPSKNFQTKLIELPAPKVQPASTDERKNAARLAAVAQLKKQLEKNPGLDKVYYGFSYDGEKEECTYVRFR